MALTAEQRQRKRQRKLERAARPQAAPAPPTEVAFGDFLGCWSLFRDRDVGMFHILVARHRTGGLVRTCGFLVDEFGNGVKDAWWADGSERGSLRRLESAPRREEMTAIPPAEALRLLQEAAQTAQNRGFEPHPLFRSSMSIFEGVVAHASVDPAPPVQDPDLEEAPPEARREGLWGFLLRLFGRQQVPGPGSVA